jgi:hypothetical protein
MATRPIRFLLVEDDDDHAELIQLALEDHHVFNTVDRVCDGAEALEYLRKTDLSQPLVVLLDLKLPRIGGHEVLASMKADPSLLNIPVVVLTTSQAETDKAKAYELHANSYLVKPVNFSKFQQMAHDLKLYWSVWNEPA